VGRRVESENRSRGQSLTEFALLLPVLIVFVLITIDFGRLFMSYVTLTNATRVAANYGSTDPAAFSGTPNTATYDAMVTRETSGLNCALRPDSGGNNPPIPTYPNGSQLGGTSVASMTCDFTLLTPLLTTFFGGPLPISASARFPIRTGAIANIGGSTTVPPPGSPVADFRFTGVSGGTVNGSGNVTGTAPVTVNVVDDSVNAQTWTWDWGDGSPDDTGPTPPAHTYSGANTYTVTLTVTNTIGTSVRTRSVTATSTTTGPPVAGFYGTPVANPPRYTAGGTSTGAPIQGSLPLVVDFTNLSTNGTAYSWDFGDGSAPSTATSPQHQYSVLGVFTVTLTITAPTGGSPFIRTAYVTTGCVVPNFANTSTSATDATWAAAGFSGPTTFHEVGKNGNGNPNPPQPPKNIESQSVPGGTFVPATRQGSNYVCDTAITVHYTP
jgi:PKD repeat protein